MDTAIQITWWIGLVGALVLTGVILKEVALLLRALADIARLAEIIREAARALAVNVEGSRHLTDVAHPAGELSARALALREAAVLAARPLRLRPSRPAGREG